MIDIYTRSGHITAGFVTSKSGDHELHIFEGALTVDEFAEKVFQQNPEWWASVDDIWVRDISVVEFLG